MHTCAVQKVKVWHGIELWTPNLFTMQSRVILSLFCTAHVCITFRKRIWHQMHVCSDDVCRVTEVLVTQVDLLVEIVRNLRCSAAGCFSGDTVPAECYSSQARRSNFEWYAKLGVLGTEVPQWSPGAKPGGVWGRTPPPRSWSIL